MELILLACSNQTAQALPSSGRSKRSGREVNLNRKNRNEESISCYRIIVPGPDRTLLRAKQQPEQSTEQLENGQSLE
jgi:hypothetical protein